MVSSPRDKQKGRRPKLKDTSLPFAKVLGQAPKFPFHQTRRFWIGVFVLSLASFVLLVGENYMMRAIVGKWAEPDGTGFRRQAVFCLKVGTKMFMRKIVLTLIGWWVNGVRPANGGMRGGT